MKNFSVSIVMICMALLAIPYGDAAAQPSPPLVTFEQATRAASNYDASMVVTSPLQGDVVTLQSDCDTCPKFLEFDASLQNFDLGEKSLGQFPCEPLSYHDSLRWKGNGQHLYIVVDKGAGRVIADLNSPAYIPVEQPTPGPHTLRVYMVRSWDESLKAGVSPARATDLYAVRTFYIGTNDGTHAIDTAIPLLTANSPLDTNYYKYPPDSVLFDFNLMFKDLSDGYRVEATVYDSTDNIMGRETLAVWTPYCIRGFQEPPLGRLGKYFIRARLLDMSGLPVVNGPGNFNDQKWAFWIRRH